MSRRDDPGGNAREVRNIPEAWFKMFDWFEAHPNEPLYIQCESARKAHNMRFEFYRIRKAVCEESELKGLYPNLMVRKGLVRGSQLILDMVGESSVTNCIESALKAANGVTKEIIR